MISRYTLIAFAFSFLWVFTSCSNEQNERVRNTSQAEADSLAEKMYAAYDAYDFRTTLELGQQSMQKYEALNDTTSMCDVMSTLSVANMRLGNIAEGLRIAERIISIDSIKGDPELLSNDYNTIAGIYLMENNGKEAEPLILKAIDYELQTSEQKYLSNRYGIASEVYCKLDRPKEALEYARKGLDVAREHKDSTLIGKRLSQLGQAYICANLLNEAERTLRECAGILIDTHSDLSLAITYRQLGNIFERQHQDETAIAYYKKALALARKTNYTMLICQCTQDIGELTASSQPAYAISMLKESRALSDTLHSHKVEEMMADFSTRYDLNEKRLTIEEQAAELKMHRILLLVIIITLIAVAIVLLLSIHMKRLRRSNEQLEARYSEKVVKQTQHQEPEFSSADQEFIDKLATYIDEHISESDLSSTTIAEAFCLSPRQFTRRVKQLMGIDTTHYIRASRIVKARKLLSETNLAIQDIYVKCGFESASYFTRIFRTDVGVTPSEYRKNSTV